MRRITNLLVFLMTGFFSSAQESGRMETDRPDQTESPVIVKQKYIQMELGLLMENDREGYSTFLYPTLLTKYGLSKKFEFRLITEWMTLETPIMIPQGNDFISGLNPVQIGFKYNFFEESGLRPMTSIIAHVGIPTLASEKFSTPHLSPNFRFTMQHTLAEGIGLGYNIGAEWDGVSKTPYYIYTFAPGFNLGKNGYAYAEAFGAIRKNEPPQHSVDGGFAYYINDNLKADISAGKGISKAAPDWYASIGFSIRFNTSK